MTNVKIAAVLSLLAFSLISTFTTAIAATAHNSQAGANGGTSDNDGPIHKHMRKNKHKG